MVGASRSLTPNQNPPTETKEVRSEDDRVSGTGDPLMILSARNVFKIHSANQPVTVHRPPKQRSVGLRMGGHRSVVGESPKPIIKLLRGRSPKKARYRRATKVVRGKKEREKLKILSCLLLRLDRGSRERFLNFLLCRPAVRPRRGEL